MRYKINIFLFPLIVYCPALAQHNPAMATHKTKTIAGSYHYFTIDNLENIYLLTTSNQLKKINSKGDSIAVFNDIKKFGEVYSIDVSNPLKILLYYKNFPTIAVLDGVLNLKNSIDLRKQNIFRVSAVGLSYDGKIWLFDEMDNTLKKIDERGHVLLKTPDLRHVFDKTITPEKIFDQNQLVYLYDPANGMYVFDYYGTFKNRIDITGWNNLRVVDKYVWGSDSSVIYRYHIPTLHYSRTLIPPDLPAYRQLLYSPGYIYGLRNDGLDIIKLQD